MISLQRVIRSYSILQFSRTLIDTIPDIAWLKDTDGNFILVNEALAKSCGMKVEEIIGKTDQDLRSKELADGYQNDDKRVMKSGKRIRVEEQLIDNSGKEMWIDTIKSPIFDDNQKASIS